MKKHIFTQDFLPRQGDVFVADMNITDSEGNILIYKRRPVIVVQNDWANNPRNNMTVVIPVMSYKGKKFMATHLPLFDHEGGLHKPSIAHAENITSIRRSDLRVYIGRVDKDVLDELVKRVNILLAN